MNLRDIDIDKDIHDFIHGLTEFKDLDRNKGRSPLERYSSFDYCFNYFQSFRESNLVQQLAAPEHIEMSCLQLGFYLASWGMLRGSSFLLEKSVKHFQAFIDYISAYNPKIWEIDASNYFDNSNVDILMNFRKEAGKLLKGEKDPTDTLITKIMLGVFGNVPAFDNYFMSSFNMHSFNPNAIEKIGLFYKTNRKIIDHFANSIYTYDFLSGEITSRNYSQAKIIDMVGFIEGYRDMLKRKRLRSI